MNWWLLSFPKNVIVKVLKSNFWACVCANPLLVELNDFIDTRTKKYVYFLWFDSADNNELNIFAI